MRNLSRFFTVCFCVSVSTSALASSQVNIGNDDANQGMYNTAWNDGTGGDNGFFPWKIVTRSQGEGGFAGHYLAKKKEHPVVEPITTDRAFALFANGSGFEEAVAFRGLAVPLEAEDNFSFDILHGPFVAKGDKDSSEAGEVGFTFRTGNANESVEDVNTGARLRFFARKGMPNYLIADSETEFDTGIPITQEALAITLTMVDSDTYDMEVINLRDNSRKLIEGRKLGGESKSPINSFAFFNKNSETNDLFFNNFQFNRNAP